MAVEIPVYVDIQGAFDRAVQEIPKEVPKLEKVLSRYALNMKIDFGGGDMRTVRNLLTDTTMDAEELERALKKVRKAYNDAVAKGASKTKTSATVNNLAKAYGLLSQRVKGFYDSNAVAAMRLEDTIAKVTFKVKEMRAQLSTLAPGSDAYNKINYDLKLQQQRLAELTMQQMKYKAGIDASTSAYQKQSGVVKQLAGYFSGLYAAHSLIRFARQVRDVTGELEYQRVALGHLLQDEAFGDELFAKTIEAAKESPFRIGQLVRYTKELAAYRIEQENLFDTTQRLADISAGLGVDMERLILAYGQVRAASVLRGQELRQFTEAGIPLVDLLAKKFRDLGREGTTTADVFKLISERAVPFEYIKQIFEELTDAGGMFYKMQETQAKTLQGRWEKLKDAYDQALMRVGDTDTFQAMNDRVLGILTSLSKNLTSVVRIANAGSIAWAAYWLTMKSGISYGVKLTNMFIREYGVIKTLTMGVGGLTAAFKRLLRVLKSNLVGIALSAAAGIYTYVTQFKQKTEEVTKELDDMQIAIDKMKNANKKLEFDSGLIDSYKELSETTGRTAVQSSRLESVIQELKRAYPELADKIGDTNTPLKEQIELLGAAAKASHELAVEEAKKQLHTQELIIKGYEDELDAAKETLEIARQRQREAELREEDYMHMFESQETLKENTIAAAKAAKSASDAYEEVAKKLADARREAELLKKVIFPVEEDQPTGWRALLADARKYMSEGVPKEIFTEKDIQGWDSLGEAIKKLKPQYDEAKKTYEGLVSAVKEGGKLVRPELEEEKKAAEDAFDAWKALDALLGGLLSTKKTTGSDTRLSNLKKDISEITNAYKKFLELRKYMSDSQALSEIGTLFPQLKGWEPSFEKTIEKLQDMRKKVVDQLAKSPNDKTLLEMQRTLDTEISNLRFDDLKKKFDSELKRIKDEIKRSETARSFYQDILGLTGDEELAANMAVSVYGDPGKELGDRIRQSIADALNAPVGEGPSVTAAQRSAIENAAKNLDFREVLKEVDQYPDHVRDAVKEAADIVEKYNMDIAKSFAELVSKYGSTQQKIDTITAKATNEIKKVKEARDKALKEPGVTTEQSKKINDRADEVIKALEAQRDLDIFKAGDDYIKFFAELNVMTADQAALVRTKLRDAYFKAFHDGAINADELSKNLRAIDTQFRKLTQSSSLLESYLDGGFDKANEKLQEYADNVSVLAQKMKSGKELSADEQNFATKMLSQFGSGSTANIESYQQLIEAFSGEGGGLEAAGEAFGQMGEGMSAMAANGPGALAIVDAIFKAVHATISGIQQIIDQLNEVRSEENKIGDWFKYISDFDRYTFSGWEKLKSGDAIGATVDAISSWISIFTNAQKDKVKKFNDQIKEQGTLLEDLEYEYSRLSVAIEKSFGSDYISNYNKQLDVLQAQAEAYRKQAELERKKGKSADEDTAKGYEKSARDVEDQIADMQSQLSEFMSGTDLTSAAKDFAEAWIEAYKEFGSTTDAMSEKFNDMVQNMVVNSLAAQLIQGILKPIFDQIDAAAKDGALSAEEIASISALVPDAMAQIDAGMTGLMSQLTAAGVNLRQQAGSFTGISRDIASASEESITGLAAGINTQNFYMQHIDMNVALILSALTGGTTTGQASVTGQVADPYKDEMLKNASHIPSIDQNLAALLTEVRRVIKPRDSARSSSYVLVTDL